MEYKNSLDLTQTKGFDWALFRDYFPFGDISVEEGNYQRLVEVVLEALSLSEEQTQLIAMLDAQAAIFWSNFLVKMKHLKN